MDPSELILFLRGNSQSLLILGIVVITASLILHLRRRRRQEAERSARRREEIRKAHEAEKKRQLQLGQKVKFDQTVSANRIPLPEPYDHTFSGSATPRNLAKWEAEIHQIGRQTIGQIDSKMVALQVLTLEANRVANRLEILVDHLETLVGSHSQIQNQAGKQNEIIPETMEELGAKEEESGERFPSGLISVDQMEREGHSVRMEAFTDILDDLETELDQFHEETAKWNSESLESGSNQESAQRTEQILPASIIKGPEKHEESISHEETVSFAPDSKPLPASISLSSGSPLSGVGGDWPSGVSSKIKSDKPVSKGPKKAGDRSPFALSSPRLPGDLFSDSAPDGLVSNTSKTSNTLQKNATARQISSDRQAPELMPSLREKSLQSPHLQSSKSAFQKASRIAGQSVPASNLLDEVDPPIIRGGSRLALRKQVEMLADYGYTANQIAQNLNITVGEVDLMLSLRS